MEIDISHQYGDDFYYSIETNPDVGSTVGVNQSNGTKTCPISSLTYDTTYDWTVSVRDSVSGEWTNYTYFFSTESEPNDDGGSPGGGSPGGGGFFPPPPVEDVNNAPYKPVKPSGSVYIEPGVSFEYSSSSFDKNDDMIRYRFRWGDGNRSEWTEFVESNLTVSKNYTWLQADSFSVEVMAQDEHGLNSSWSDPLLVIASFAENESVNNSVPFANFTFSVPETTNATMVFNASESYDLDGVILTYSWDFGDGSTAFGMNVTHTFEKKGVYNVTLVVIDDAGSQFSKTMRVSVNATSAENAEVQQDTWSLLPFIAFFGGFLLVILFYFLVKDRIALVLKSSSDKEPNEVGDSTPFGFDVGETFVDGINRVEQWFSQVFHPKELSDKEFVVYQNSERAAGVSADKMNKDEDGLQSDFMTDEESEDFFVSNTTNAENNQKKEKKHDKYHFIDSLSLSFHQKHDADRHHKIRSRIDKLLESWEN